MGSTSPKIISLTKRWRKVPWLWPRVSFIPYHQVWLLVIISAFRFIFIPHSSIYRPGMEFKFISLMRCFTFEALPLGSRGGSPRSSHTSAVGWLLILPVKSSNQAAGFYITKTSCNSSGRRVYGTNVTDGKDKELDWINSWEGTKSRSKPVNAQALCGQDALPALRHGTLTASPSVLPSPSPAPWILNPSNPRSVTSRFSMPDDRNFFWL